jgi:hypothetical protein
MATFDSAVAAVKQLTQAQIAATARRENEKIVAAPPRPLRVVRHVDGVKDAPEEAVKPGGVIVYDYERIDLVALYALDVLRQLSPVDTGDYVRSHVLMLNGVVVGSPDSSRADLRVADLANWQPGDRITISNLMPYTRKIEIGKQGYRKNGHVYEKAALAVNRRFGNIAQVYFTYEKAPRGGGAAGIHSWAWNTRRTKSLSASAQGASNQEWLTRQPTLVITSLV